MAAMPSEGEVQPRLECGDLGQIAGYAGLPATTNVESGEISPSVVLAKARTHTAEFINCGRYEHQTTCLRQTSPWGNGSWRRGRHVHWGATTQDIMDTAALLQLRAGFEPI